LKRAGNEGSPTISRAARARSLGENLIEMKSLSVGSNPTPRLFYRWIQSKPD